MRISLVVPRYLPHLGGIENHVSALAVRLRKQGHHVTVATQRGRDRSLPHHEVDAHGVTVRRFASAARLGDESLSPTLWHWVRSGADGADVVHLHNYHAVSTLATLTAVAGPAPVLFTPHYMGPGDGTAERLMHRAFASGMQRALRAIDTIIFTTPSEGEAFKDQIGFGGHCTVIPNGVDTAAIRAAEPVTVDAGRLVVTAGRFEEYKQHHVLVESLLFLPPEYRLALIGAGPMEESLRRRATELGLTDRVLFTGRLSTAETFRWYRAAEVVVSLSRREGFGLTLAEGLAAGAAVVASDIGPHRDVMEIAGVSKPDFVPVRPRPEEVGAAVAAARRPPDVTGKRLPDWDDMTVAIVACYEEVRRG
jgi:glycosyltransferase involved in cell wall biosynthesis